ncbi:hypothetical protein BOO91_16065 [Vibrio navarrensis]|nr:hypothetical protein [Vibrio navarrensis]
MKQFNYLILLMILLVGGCSQTKMAHREVDKLNLSDHIFANNPELHSFYLEWHGMAHLISLVGMTKTVLIVLLLFNMPLAKPINLLCPEPRESNSMRAERLNGSRSSRGTYCSLKPANRTIM